MSGYDRRPLLSAPPIDRSRFPVNSKHEYAKETGWMPSAGRHVDSSASFDCPPPFNPTPSLFNPLPALYPTPSPVERSSLPRQQVDNFGAWLRTSSQSHGHGENGLHHGGDGIASAAYQNDDRYRASETANMCWEYQNGDCTRTYDHGSSTECVDREAPASERYFARGPTFPQQGCPSGSSDYVSGEYNGCAQPFAVDESSSWERDWRHGGSFGGFENKPASDNRLPFADGGADLSNSLAVPSKYCQPAADNGSQSQASGTLDFRAPYGYSAQRFQFGKDVAKSRGPSNDKGVRAGTTKFYRKPHLKANSTKAAPKVSLYCKVCKVKLNAEGQALQHYAGKMHAKRLLLHTSADSLKQEERSASAALKDESRSGHSGSRSAVSATTMTVKVSPSQDRIKQESPWPVHKEHCDAGTREQEAVPLRKLVVNDPLVYCNLCGTSFNAAVQAELHYKGKKHKARVASSSCSTKNRVKAGPASVVPSKEEQRPQDGSDRAPAAETSTAIDPAGDSGGCTESSDSQASAAADTKTAAGQAYIAVPESVVDCIVQEPDASHGIVVDSLKETKMAGDVPDDYKKKNAAIRYSCDVCKIVLTSQVQLTQHLQGARHARHVRGVPSRPYNNGRKRPFGQKVGTNRAQPEQESAGPAGMESAGGPVPKRYREDIVLMRSDRFYCGWCNATCDTELSYKSHLESRRHKSTLAFHQASDMAYNY